MHYYQFNIGDYRADTAHLSIIEHGIYRQLIDWYYLDEKPIPKETQVVMRRLRLGSDEQHYLTNVLADFFVLTDFGYFHNRITIELEQYQVQFAKNRVNGQKGGRPAKPIDTPIKTQVVSKNNHMATQINPNQQPITNNHKPITNIKPLEDFELFWKEYPKKVGKEAARKSWVINKPPIDLVLDSLRWQKRTTQWSKSDGQFIPNPTTWLNQGRWQDEVQEDSADAWINSTSPFSNLLTEKEVHDDRPREAKLLEHD